jgi:hypothetical protein
LSVLRDGGVKVTRYPILFGRHELIEGNGFIARVALHGRLLLTEEAGEYWVEGVNPGGIAARGDSPSEALASFSAEYRVVLFDIAADAPSFGELKTEVERFFNETSPAAVQEWMAAVEEVRAGKVEAGWLNKRPAESPLGVDVVAIQQPQAANNEEDEAAIAA